MTVVGFFQISLILVVAANSYGISIGHWNCTSNNKCLFYGQCSGGDCICAQKCDRNKRPVCGSNGRTYLNLCHLQSHACLTKSHIVLSRNGQCSTICNRRKRCKFYGICKNGQCTCSRVCPKQYQPVCGSDRKTYGHICLLQVESCLSETWIRLVRYGQCS